ncbi:preprotein translocase subunit TatA [Pseudonocardia sp. CNS-139]|nr:preprotein translocase subunit TatA [Pseudonocardia sp. CNS-139]
MPSLGGWEFVILIGILVLLFGARRLPDMARSIGQSARVFRGEMRGMKSDDETRKAGDQPAPQQPAALPQAQVQAQQAAEAPKATQPGSTPGSTAQ